MKRIYFNKKKKSASNLSGYKKIIKPYIEKYKNTKEKEWNKKKHTKEREREERKVEIIDTALSEKDIWNTDHHFKLPSNRRNLERELPMGNFTFFQYFTFVK